MDALTIAWVVFLVVFAPAAVGLARAAWRLRRGDEEAVAGGSVGMQLLGRRAKRR